MKNQRAAAVVVLAVLVAVVAAGCGSSGSDSKGTTTTVASTTAAKTSDTAVTETDSGSSGTSGATTTTAGGGSGAVAGVPGQPVVAKPAVAPLGQVTEGTITTPDGRARTYRVFVPRSVTARAQGQAVPLLIALHGGTGWGAQFERNSDFDGLAESNQFIVAYPDGIGVGAKSDQLRTWNGGACCGPATKQNVDDVGFIRALITKLEGEHDIDKSRVFASGHSNGGILSLRLACELSDQIVAIGIQSSALEVDSCTPQKPVSVLQIHGTADKNIPIGGGIGPNAISGVSFNVPKDAATTLAKTNDCDPPTDVKDPSNPDITTTEWATCKAGTQVAFVQVEGATHAWMGHSTAIPKTVGTPYQNLDSSLTIWNFLSQHPRQ